jgi:hypothetical protein
LRSRASYDAFLQARQATQWHYQWLLVNEHLPQIASQAVVDDVLQNGNRFYDPPPGDAFMPIEFGAAAYRFGHSMVRPSYRANFSSGTGDSTSPTKDPFFALVFDRSIPAAEFSAAPSFDRDELLGGFPAPRRYIGWQTFFDLGDGQVKNNKKVDTAISSVLFTLPVPAIAPHTQTSPTVLPQRNLLRQLTWSLPSGQAIAAAIGITPLTGTHAPAADRSQPRTRDARVQAGHHRRRGHLTPSGKRRAARGREQPGSLGGGSSRTPDRRGKMNRRDDPDGGRRSRSWPRRAEAR